MSTVFHVLISELQDGTFQIQVLRHKIPCKFRFGAKIKLSLLHSSAQFTAITSVIIIAVLSQQ